MNVIPSIDLVDGDVVRLIQGDPKRLIVYDSNPIKIAISICLKILQPVQ